MAIPAGSTDFKTKGSLGEVEDIEMTIDEKGFKFLMSILTNLYEYPVLAVIREYCTNAVDAHIDAGYDGPVQVTMPTWDKPEFKVRDFGPGMDLDDIRNTYSKYVASTKRQDNTQAGMFGIGAKSALALGDQFTVTSIKGGRKIVVLVQRKGRGEASMKVLVNDQPTSERNGTLITVPAESPNRFTQQAHKFFPYVKKGLFTVDGEDRGESFEGVKINDTLYALPQSHYNNTSYIVMGNVPYPVETTERRRVVKYVPAGTFEPTPPREALEQGKGFMHTIKSYLDEAGVGLAKRITDDIKDMTPDAAATYVSGNQSLLTQWGALGEVEYAGHKFSDDFNYGQQNAVRIMGSSSFDASGSVQFWDYFLGGHIVDFDGKAAKDVTKYTCQKANAAKSFVGQPRSVFVYLNGAKPKYAASSRTITWDKAKTAYTSNYYSGHTGPNVHAAGDDWKVPTRKVSYNRDNTPKFTTSNTKVVPYGDYKGKRDLVYFSPTELDTQAKVNLVNAMMDDKDVFVVVKNMNQHDKTKRVNPEAIHINDYGSTMAARLLAKNGQRPYLSISLPYKWDKIEGELFDEARAIYAKTKVPTPATREERALVREFAKSSLTIEDEWATIKGRIEDEYPLVTDTSYSTPIDHLNTYVKAMDAFRKDNQ